MCVDGIPALLPAVPDFGGLAVGHFAGVTGIVRKE